MSDLFNGINSLVQALTSDTGETHSPYNADDRALSLLLGFFVLAVLSFRPVYRERSGRMIIIFPLFETSYSWVEMFVSKVALLGLSVVVSVVAMTAPTSAPTIGTDDDLNDWRQRTQKEPIARMRPTCRTHLRNQVVIRVDS